MSERIDNLKAQVRTAYLISHLAQAWHTAACDLRDEATLTDDMKQTIAGYKAEIEKSRDRIAELERACEAGKREEASRG